MTRPPSIAAIQRAVCEQFGMRPANMTDGNRALWAARPRQVAMYLARRMTPQSLPQIGKAFGGRNHTTVLHAVEIIAQLRERDRDLDAAIEAVSKTVLGDPAPRIDERSFEAGYIAGFRAGMRQGRKSARN